MDKVPRTIIPNWSTRVKVFNWPNTSTLLTHSPKISWASSSILKISSSSASTERPLTWCPCRLWPLLSTCRRWAWMLLTCWRASSSTRTCKLNIGSCRSNTCRWLPSSSSNKPKLRLISKTIRSRRLHSLKLRHRPPSMRITTQPNLKSSSRRHNRSLNNKLKLTNKFSSRYWPNKKNKSISSVRLKFS